jgi:DNA-binding transcriptional regulator YdaS (Cro superfamily)
MQGDADLLTAIHTRSMIPSMKGKPLPVFERYVAIVGTRNDAVRRLGISRPMVDLICQGRRGISVKLARRIHEDTKGLIPLEEIRPDVWGGLDRAA